MTLVPPSFILIFDPAPVLTITPSRYSEWRLHADDGGVIIWNRQGSVGIISTDVLDNALRIYSEYVTMIGAGRYIGDIPRTAREITWEQATKTKVDKPRPVDV